jgi:hypothetical protein
MKDDPKPRIEEVVENEYFENTLEKFRWLFTVMVELRVMLYV